MSKQDISGAAAAKESLFLLEVLIDKIIFVKSPCFSDKDFRTCVNFSFLSVDPLEICDDDLPSDLHTGGPFIKNFNIGKSCLFSLKENEISQSMSKFPIKVKVSKSLPCGCLPTYVVMGEATIDMTKEFVMARNSYLKDPNIVSHQALKDSFRITAADNSVAGDILMFLRISCFGKLIITKFQGGQGGGGMVGGGGGGGNIDRSCKSKRDFQTADDPCSCGTRGGGGGNVCNTGGGTCAPAKDPYNSMPCEESDDPCYCGGPKPQAKDQMACRNTDQYCLHVPKDCCPPGNRVVFQMPSDCCGMGHKQRAHFNFNSDGVGDVSRDEPGQLVPANSEDYSGVVYDFPAQVIKLRIGRTMEMPGRKSKLEYQFVTPVINHEKPVTKHLKVSKHPKLGVPIKHYPLVVGAPTGLPFIQALDEDRKRRLIFEFEDKHSSTVGSRNTKPKYLNAGTQKREYFNKNVQTYLEHDILSTSESSKSTITHSRSSTSMFSNQDSKRVSFCDICDYINSNIENIISFKTSVKKSKSIITEKEIMTPDSYSCLNSSKPVFGNNDIKVYMTLYNTYSRYNDTRSTQATASVNKCLQVSRNEVIDRNRIPVISGVLTPNEYFSSCTNSTMGNDDYKQMNRSFPCPEVYFFGRNSQPSSSNMRNVGSQSQMKRCGGPCSKKIVVGNAAVQVKGQNSTTDTQTRGVRGSAAGTSTGKSVSINDKHGPRCPRQKPCPHGGPKGQELISTISHIRIGPKDACALHCPPNPDPQRATGSEDRAPVKLSTVNNPRRGVFELVIRRLNGAPLAKNELMLEWTPPQAKSPPCGGPCLSTCRSKCKMIVCKPMACKMKCKKPCGKPPCYSPCIPPKCGKPCKSCCKPCPPRPCRKCCSVSCSSSPCLRPCPVGRKKHRRCRSQPKIRPHRKMISPCLNRAPVCPVVKCRSLPGPCCALPCPPKKCCSIIPCAQPPRCCKSTCSSCCPPC